MLPKPHINSFTPSDVMEWTTVMDGEDLHVMPKFGPPHSATMTCWCHPAWNIERYTEDAVLHNVAH